MYLRKDNFFVLFCFKSSQKIMMPAPSWNTLLIPPWISQPDNSGGLVCISQLTFKSITKPCKPSTQAQYSAHLTHLSKDTGSGQSPALMTSLRALLVSCAYFSVFPWFLEFLSHLNSCSCNKCLTYLAFVYIFSLILFLLHVIGSWKNT